MFAALACAPADRGETNPAPASEVPPAGAGAAQQPASDPRPVVLFVGTSLTAGLGVSPEEAYPARVQEKIDSAGLGYRVVNAGVSGETSAGGLTRIDWLLRAAPDVLVLELGANDALRGQDPEATRRNLQAIIDHTRSRYPDAGIVIAGMRAPPNLGARYADAFAALFPALARDNDAALIPFLLDGVAAVPELNRADGIHPTAAGQEILAANAWRVLEPMLKRRVRRAHNNALRTP